VKSGTRLHAKVGTTVDGASWVAGWYDTQLGIDCAFQVASDGLTRCMPATIVSGPLVYADDLCTQPIIAGTCQGVPVASYVAVFQPASSCGEPAGYVGYQVGAEIHPSEYYFPTSPGSGCTGGQGDVSAPYWDVRALPASTFVQAAFTD
jgi:hypothetical protein